MARRPDGERPEDRLLEEMIEAARRDAPTDSEWEGARRRLTDRLERRASRTEPAGRRTRAGSGPAVWARLRQRPLTASFSAAAVLVALFAALLVSMSSPNTVQAASVNGGDLRIVGPDGETSASCPLRHTKVEAGVTGFVSRTLVRQTFENPLQEKIEAVYVFPLPSDAAVDSMVILVGERRIVGSVKPRQEARRVYETARAAGRVAGLLDQERPNIFTQSVANIAPGAKVVVEISYVETLKLEDGFFEYAFPMVVAPRYIPGQETATATQSGTGTSVDTDQVPDASRISPCTCPPETRAGHDIDVEVLLQAGSEIFDVETPLHEVNVERTTPDTALISLKNGAEIPNKDFVLRFRTATDAIGDAFLTADSPLGRFFAVSLQPPRRVEAAQVRPKEMIFVIDRSGSMNGEPIQKAKQTMRLCIEGMNPRDTFNLLSFSGGTGKCFDRPQPNTAETRQTAIQYLNDLQGSGGTEMMPAILEALGGPADPERVRIVCFMTDGEIGNDYEILDAVKKNAGVSRVFSFGIGNSTNRFLLEGIAREGRGEVQFVTLGENGAEAAEKFKERLDSPVLTDISIDWGTLGVAEVYPALVPDLYARKPILVTGRLTGPPQGEIILRGNTAEGSFERRIAVKESTGPERRDGLDVMWARAKVKHLLGQDLQGMQTGRFRPELKDEVTTLGVTFGLMTPFTSFVAVDEVVATEPGEPKRLDVPVEMPEGQTQGTERQRLFSTTAPGKLDLNFTYDPTNGTVSEGDVYRVKQDGAVASSNSNRYARSAPRRSLATDKASAPMAVAGEYKTEALHGSNDARPQVEKPAQPTATPQPESYFESLRKSGFNPIEASVRQKSSRVSNEQRSQASGIESYDINTDGYVDVLESSDIDIDGDIDMAALQALGVQKPRASAETESADFRDLTFANGAQNGAAPTPAPTPDILSFDSRNLVQPPAPSATPATPSSPVAPAITGLPDIIVGDAEASRGEDSSLFIFKGAFRFDDEVTESDATVSEQLWSFDELDLAAGESPGSLNQWYTVNGSPAASTGSTSFTASTLSPTAITTTQPLLRKLDPRLQRLERLLDGEGNLTTGPVRVTRYQVAVVVEAITAAEDLEKALAGAGFRRDHLAAPGQRIRGRVDVRRLGELAALPMILRISPAEENSGTKSGRQDETP